MEILQSAVRQKFLALYRREPLIIRSPGRINLIGEHTDYNDGFVMPAAIDKEIVFGIGHAMDEQITIHALNFNESYAVKLSDIKIVDHPKWANYLLGVVHRIMEKGYAVKPFTCVFEGNIPTGAGLSSSAALECGLAYGLNELFNFGISKVDLALIGQWAEHNYVGVKCGIMDQFASVMGKEGHVIMLDCRSLMYHYFPIALNGYSIVLCDTNVKHSLADSEYNTRRKECEEGVQILRKQHPEIKSLRDASIEIVKQHEDRMPPVVYKRCLYIVGEISRVQAAGQDLKNGKLEAFGSKMYETHEGLSKLYEVSCAELDYLVEKAHEFKVLGSRMMGGGFGGCTINIVRNETIKDFIAHAETAYVKKFNRQLTTYVVNVKDGTSIVAS
jgi:galactokinase